jgi:hypothetical protein
MTRNGLIATGYRNFGVGFPAGHCQSRAISSSTHVGEPDVALGLTCPAPNPRRLCGFVSVKRKFLTLRSPL